jgi:hypothetical protein
MTGWTTINLPNDIRLRKTQCDSCVFRPVCDGGIDLAPGRHEEIQVYLMQGENQLCHHDDNKTICLGGRKFQLEIWTRLGFIREPTNKALRERMEELGMEPKIHI